MNSSIRELRTTAIHEASHAEMFIHHRIRFKSVSIIPDEGTLGRVVHCPIPVWAKHPDMRPCRVGPEKWNQLRGMDYWTKRMEISLAGQIGESIFLGRPSNPAKSRDDDHSRVSVSFNFCGSFEEIEAWHNWLAIRTRQHFSLPNVWHSVKMLADHLIVRKELSYRLAKDIVERAYQSVEAKRLMEDYAKRDAAVCGRAGS